MQLGKLFHVFTTLLVNQTFSDRILHAVACVAVINQSLFATGFDNWHFHYQISQIWRFSKGYRSENYCLILNSEKHLATVFVISKLG